MDILIIGAGAYGLALSTILSDKNKVTIYSSIKEEIEKLKKTYKNENLFPDIELSKKISFINKIEKKYDLIVLALPTNILEQELLKIKEEIKKTPIVITSKGIHKNKFPYDIVKENIETDEIYVLSGPSFAKDLIKKQTVSLTLAGNKEIKEIFNEEYISIEQTNDIIGTELCGSLKNIFAIGTGILEGLNVSESTKASFLTKVINDTKRIIKSLNGNENTIFMSCGIGDTILTCTSKSSRNYTFGYLIGNKKNKEELEKYIKETTIEGLDTLKEYKELFKKQGLNIEIINILNEIIFNNMDPLELVKYITMKV